MKPYTGGTVMPQNAETLVRNKHHRIMDAIPRTPGVSHVGKFFHEYLRYEQEQNSLNSPQIDRRPKK